MSTRFRTRGRGEGRKKNRSRMEHPTLWHVLPSAGRTHQRRRLLLPKRSTRDLIAASTPVEGDCLPEARFRQPSLPVVAAVRAGSVGTGAQANQSRLAPWVESRDPSNRREGRSSRRQDRSLSTGTGRLNRRSSPAAPPDIDDPAATPRISLWADSCLFQAVCIAILSGVYVSQRRDWLPEARGQSCAPRWLPGGILWDENARIFYVIILLRIPTSRYHHALYNPRQVPNGLLSGPDFVRRGRSTA